MDKKKLLDWLDEWLDIVCLAVASLALLLALMPSNAMGEAGATTDASGSQEPVEKVIETDDSANQDDSSSSAAVAPVVDDLAGSARTDASASVVEPASTAAASAAPTPDEATQPDAEPIEAAPAETAPVTIENPVATIGSTQYASVTKRSPLQRLATRFCFSQTPRPLALRSPPRSPSTSDTMRSPAPVSRSSAHLSSSATDP